MQVFTAEQWFPRPLAEVFPFFANPRNLERITPPWLRFEIVGEPDRGMAEGARIDYQLRIHGIPCRWQSEITVWQPPHRFVDEQRRGPYRAWRHEHRFEEVNGVTRVTDEVHYRVLGGRLVAALLVRRDLERIFHYRRLALEGLFGILDGPAPAVPHRNRFDEESRRGFTPVPR